MRELALDTETTGLSFIDGDKIIEIGCVEIVDKKITGPTFHTYVNPQREVSSAAAEISGLTYSFLKQFKPFPEVCQEFLEFVADDKLVIHNAPFDIGFLNNELSLIGISPLQNNRVVDTLVMAKEKYPGSPSTLDALCRRFSINSTLRTKHGALIDAELLAAVYINMSVELLQKGLFDTARDNGFINNSADESMKIIEPRHFELDETELAARYELLKKIKNPIWDRIK
ncbi:MAG: DNA polymerase III subunit epsilon [Holosporales bacterium]|jgi:DNA polymerase-3 subunit epsilon|nr:DNA polymerase III subunit epsilon [Holosporales bacterium]